MRVALTKGSLRIPPTYFAVQHALELEDRFELRFFTMAAQVDDEAILDRVAIDDASEGTMFARGRRSWYQRERALPLLHRRMTRAVLDYRPDVVHQHFANWSGPAVSASRSGGVPLLLTVHGADVYVPLTPLSDRNALGRPTLRWHQRTVRRAFAQADRVLAVSEYLAGRAREAGADPGKLEVHYQGVDTELYRPAPAAAASVPRVTAVSALSEAKGTRDLLQASIDLVRRVPHELVLVGDGPLRAAAESAAAQHPHIRVAGTLTRDGVREALQSSTVFVLPTKRSGVWREAAGLVTLEAQAMQVPVVVYDSGGAQEMFRPGDTGLLVPEGDIPELTAAIGALLALPDAERKAMGRRARDFVVNERSLAVSADQLAAHYRELAS